MSLIASRLHVHGLNTNFLNHHGFPDEEALIQDFKEWLSPKDVMTMYANDPTKENNILNLNIKDIGISPWADRV